MWLSHGWGIIDLYLYRHFTIYDKEYVYRNGRNIFSISNNHFQKPNFVETKMDLY